MPPGLSLHTIPPHRAPEVLTLRASHPIAEISYLVSFFMRYEWNQSCLPVAHNRQAGVFH